MDYTGTGNVLLYMFGQKSSYDVDGIGFAFGPPRSHPQVQRLRSPTIVGGWGGNFWDDWNICAGEIGRIQAIKIRTTATHIDFIEAAYYQE